MYDPDEVSKNRELWWANVHKHYYENNYKGAELRRTFIAETIAKNNITSVLELGCHDGSNLRYIESKNPNIKLDGIDICKNAIQFGKEKFGTKANMRVQSIYDLSNFESGSYDLVFSCTVLIHIPSEKIPNILSEMCRIGKKFVINVEDNSSENKVYWEREGIPQRFLTNYIAAYNSIGHQAEVHSMQDLCNQALGGANHFIYTNLGKEKLVVRKNK